MTDIYRPTTDDIRTAWFQLTQNTASFDQWLYEERERVWNMMAKIERESERDRIIKIMDKGTGHYAKTHSARTECKMCDLFLEIKGDANE